MVEATLAAVAEELGRVGYSALRVEDVAQRSGVNKTTIYRRWPTKQELVVAAILRQVREPEVPDTGSLREDLLSLMRQIAARMETPVGRGIVRMVQVERAQADVNELLRHLRMREQAARRVIFDRAVERGEIPGDSDVGLLVEIAMAPLIARLVHRGVPADEDFLRVLVDMVVEGAKAGAARG